ncbi:pancreatic progenitor cell differentiation and proliferation factor-like [Mustela nigripes]|uniref:pancreatic progenitor cell differentiation and proliferation factor-like n=1 Tax=Mustela lutreola TaxID=9666 RepID=UPI0027974FC2|nr:pancreatic progenitor cell differentiation and proliferation factor-like [Mustela lutreola]XP_059236383.1 pancreatic progenitor cell differentiation and proliferation factor-like [Mustela nigripes]
MRGYCQGFHQPTSDCMAAISSSSSLVATCYQCVLGSTSGNISCASAAIPRHPGLAKADSGYWWARFFFGKSTLPFMAIVLESPEGSESPQASSSIITCDSALEALRKQPRGQPGKANTGPQS